MREEIIVGIGIIDNRNIKLKEDDNA